MDESFPLMGRKPGGDWSRKVKFGFIFACLGSLLTVAAFTTAGDGALARLGDSFHAPPLPRRRALPAVDNVRDMRAMAALAQAEASTSTSANIGALASQVQELLDEVKQLTATNADLEQKLLDAENKTSEVRSKLLTSSAGGTSAHDDEEVTELRMQNDLLLERLETSITHKRRLPQEDQQAQRESGVPQPSRRRYQLCARQLRQQHRPVHAALRPGPGCARAGAEDGVGSRGRARG